MDIRPTYSKNRPTAWTERTQAGSFLITFILALVVGVALFRDVPRFFAPANSATPVSASARETRATAVPTPVPPPTMVVSSPVSNQALELIVEPTSTPTAQATPPTVPLPTIPDAPSVVPIPLSVARVANTSGDGVFLRRTPMMSDHWIAWPDNTPLLLLGNETDGDGQHWLEVRDPKNDVGWVPAQFISVATSDSVSQIP